MFIHIYYILATFNLPVVQAFDGWDDFANNLATDLAPFLSLFGEQVTKQYLSESTTFPDYFIFAMAPMGILTALVSAIRVCGGPSLRAFVGRAQEGSGNAEAELCSSTSRDVCELYNKGGIARVFGRPKILEIVYDPDNDDFGIGQPAGIYTFEKYLGKDGKGLQKWKQTCGKHSYKLRRKGDTESNTPKEYPREAFAPNLSLNIGIQKQHPAVFWIVAVGGFILQAGLLVFAGVVTYYLQWEKDDSPQEPYACPLVMIGTVLVCGGMFLCAFLVGQSTEERVWRRKMKKVDENSWVQLLGGSEEKAADDASIYWLQPGGQVIGDQTFDAFCHAEDDSQHKSFKEYTISWKNVKKATEKTQEYTVWITCAIIIPGFVLQFTGLRGMHSAVSVAQLGTIIVMSAARAALRMKRLNSNAFASNPDEIIGHELDWLATEIGRKDMKRQKQLPTPSSPASGGRLFRLLCSKPDTKPSPNHHLYFWKFHSISKIEMGSTQEDPPAINNSAARWLAYRTRLAELTESPSKQSKSAVSAQKFNVGMVEVRRTAQNLASAIEAVVRVVRNSDSAPTEWTDAISMRCAVNCEIFEYTDTKTSSMVQQQPILPTLSLQLGSKTTGSNTIADRQKFQNQLEGILGLWIWSLTDNPNVEALDKEGRFKISKAAEIPTRRIVSACQSIAQTGVGLWLPGQIPSMVENVVEPEPAGAGDPSMIWIFGTGPLKRLLHKVSEPSDERNARIFGWYAVDISQARPPDSPTVCTVPTNSSLSSLCAQEVFGSFVKSLLSIMGDIGDVTIIENPPHFRLSNALVSDIAKAFMESQLGSETEALLCTLPGVISQLRLSSLKKALIAANKSANHHRRQRAWTQAQAILKWGLEICTSRDPSQCHGEPTKDLVNEAIISLGELYRFALCDSDPNTTSFGLTGIKWLEELKAHLKAHLSKSLADSAVEIIDRYCAVKKGVGLLKKLSRDGILPTLQHEDLQKTLIYLTLMGATMASDQKGECLCLAARKGWTEVVFNLLELAADPNYRDYSPTSRTPLSYAAENGSAKIVEYLLERGVFTNPEDKQSMTPLSYASQKGQIPIIELLLKDSPVLLNLANTEGKSPLWYAAFGGHEKIVLMLLKKGAEVKTDNDSRNQILLQPARDGHERLVQILLENGARVDREAKFKNTPLHEAAYHGHERIVQILLEKGAAVDIINQYQETPLYHAAKNGHDKIAQILLENSARVDRENESLETPLSQAAMNGHERMVQILLEKGVAVDAKNMAQGTPLHQAAMNGHDKIVQILLEKGAAVDTENMAQETPLYQAAMNGHDRIAQILLEKGAAVDTENEYHETSLYQAAKNGHDRIAQILLEKGAAVNTENKSHLTPLYQAAKNGHDRIAQILLEKGAAVNTENESLETPLSQAAMNGHEKIVQILLDKGAEINQNSFTGIPLSIAARYGHERIIQILLDRGAEINQDSSIGTPLSNAARCRRDRVNQIMLILLNRGAEINQNSFIGTPLSNAAGCGHERIIQILLDIGAEINQDSSIGTPLSNAARYRYKTITQILLDNHANVHMTGILGETALHRALEGGCEKVVQMLLEKGAKLNRMDLEKLRPQLIAESRNNRMVSSLLCRYGLLE